MLTCTSKFSSCWRNLSCNLGRFGRETDGESEERNKRMFSLVGT